MAAKFKQVYDLMIEQNKVAFEEFKKLHDNFVTDPKKYQEQFNREGYDIQDIIRKYENILCGKSENGGYGKFSANLAEKFHQEIKKDFSKIDYIGLEEP